MTTTVARVEVLTAEVRVLMVGSRQVTLSVYRQLDLLCENSIDPFGRVRVMRPGEHPDPFHLYPHPGVNVPGWVEVVGVSTRTRDAGALVRSCGAPSEWLAGRIRLWRHRADLARQDGAVYVDGYSEPWTADECDLAAEVDREHADASARWEALPLIVLAGLR